MLQRSWRSFSEARPQYDAAQFVDVDYRAFVADPVGTVADICDAFGIAWSDAARAEVARIDAQSRSGQSRPSHRYDLADYGLNEEQMRAAFDG